MVEGLFMLFGADRRTRELRTVPNGERCNGIVQACPVIVVCRRRMVGKVSQICRLLPRSVDVREFVALFCDPCFPLTLERTEVQCQTLCLTRRDFAHGQTLWCADELVGCAVGARECDLHGEVVQRREGDVVAAILEGT